MLRCLIIFFLFYNQVGVNAQNGLKEVFVERFYAIPKSELKNSNLTGVSERGTVCYRIYVHLDSGFTLQAIYGSPDHPLHISSTSKIYNHPGIGSTYPNRIPDKSLKKNFSNLDSWLSVGACSESFFAIPLRFQSQASPVAIEWQEGYFMNQKGRDSKLPFRQAPGMIYLDSLPVPTFFQIDEQMKGLNSESIVNGITIDNGAWACMGKGAMAPSHLKNAILIAQITTSGKLSYELNLLIGSPDGKSLRYVAKNANSEEFTHKSLIFKQ